MVWWTRNQERLWVQQAQKDFAAADKLFVEAQTEYLQGHWFEAESLLERLLRIHPSDVEGRLLLATLYRHTDRVVEACDSLNELEQVKGVERWQLELISERRLLEDLVADEEVDGEENPQNETSHDEAAQNGGTQNRRAA